MSLFIDLKYVNIISNRFEKFQSKGNYLFNVRCPICGDSKKNKNKMRGYIYRKVNGLFYSCHNCGCGMSLGNLLKTMDSSVHREYLLERYTSGEDNLPKKTTIYNIPSPKFGVIEKKLYDNAESCDKLPQDHPCIQYLISRNIPKDKWKKLLYTEQYKDFCDEVNKNHGKTIDNDKRLVISYYSEYGELLAVSGRALESSSEKLRYVTVRTTDSDDMLIYGVDDIDITKRLYIVEGPIDSLFINNCVAAGSTSLLQTAKKLNITDRVLVFDNEPRNKEVVNIIKKSIDAGEKVVIWPDFIEGKDINEMVNKGKSVSDIKDIIDQNVYQGLEAQLKFNLWKRM